jgi:hypothetical protein
MARRRIIGKRIIKPKKAEVKSKNLFKGIDAISFSLTVLPRFQLGVS